MNPFSNNEVEPAVDERKEFVQLLSTGLRHAFWANQC
jgi:hypothetical protein